MEHGESSYRRFLAGDESAFDQILLDHRVGLIRFINQILRDPDAAEDIAIDTFLELLLHPKRYDFRSSLKTYLYMMGRSKALNYLRRRKFFSTDPIPENIPQEISLEEQFLLDERRRALHAAMKQLPEDMATALYLVYFEDLSYADTAKVMKKTPKQVDNLLYRGKAALRDLLGKDGSVL